MLSGFERDSMGQMKRFQSMGNVEHLAITIGSQLRSISYLSSPNREFETVEIYIILKHHV